MSAPIILGLGVHVLLSNQEIREVKMSPKLAKSIFELLKHRSKGGVIDLSPHCLKIEAIMPVSREKEVGYIPLARQLVEWSVDCEDIDWSTMFL